MLFWTFGPIATAASAETLDIRDAHAYLKNTSSSQEVQGNVSWIPPATTQSNPIVSYRVEFQFNGNGSSSKYSRLNCAVDVGNARCTITGTITLPAGPQYVCNETNKNFLNSLYSVSIQAQSSSASIGNEGSSAVLICNPDLISVPSSNVVTPVPTFTSTISPSASPPTPQTPDRNRPQASSPSPSATASPSSITPNTETSTLPSTSPSDNSGNEVNQQASDTQKENLIQKFGRLGLDLDEPTRKRAQSVVISYLAVVVSVSIGRKL
jgi:hypothetical protein